MGAVSEKEPRPSLLSLLTLCVVSAMVQPLWSCLSFLVCEMG